MYGVLSIAHMSSVARVLYTSNLRQHDVGISLGLRITLAYLRLGVRAFGSRGHGFGGMQVQGFAGMGLWAQIRAQTSRQCPCR